MSSQVIEVVPIVLKNVTFKVAADEYEKHVSQVEFVPSASAVNWKGLHKDAVFTDIGSATWVCNLSYAQDWATPNSLSQYLFNHEGEAVDVEFAPEVGGPGFSATLLITPGSIGGTVDAVAVGTVSLGVRGRPIFVP
jgi:hypothetical protein